MISLLCPSSQRMYTAQVDYQHASSSYLRIYYITLNTLPLRDLRAITQQSCFSADLYLIDISHLLFDLYPSTSNLVLYMYHLPLYILVLYHLYNANKFYTHQVLHSSISIHSIRYFPASQFKSISNDYSSAGQL